MTFSQSNIQCASALGSLMLAHRYMVVTAESCTGGMVSALITEIAGSSQWYDRGFITYSNQSKQQMLGISEHDLLKYGAVSQRVAALMAENALSRSQANVAVSITGIAGPDGGSDEKPVGTVWFGWKFADSDIPSAVTEHQLFSGSRNQIRLQAVHCALQGIINKYS